MTAVADRAAAPAAPQRMEFKTELKQLLDLIIHSLYTKREIFLRELVSNAADAIDKLRFEGLKNPDLLEGDTDWRIRLIPDAKAGTLTVSDNGVGMSRESIVENLGTIARSGTRAFLDSLRQADVKDRPQAPELIGQFGVGFYSSFMVADRVTVISRPAGPNSAGEAVRWESDGQGQFTVEPYDKPTRGTDVILHLRKDTKPEGKDDPDAVGGDADATEFLTPWRLRDIVKRYSDYVEHPIVVVTTEEKDGKAETKEETVNSRQAIWLRPKSEITPEEYNAFYQQISHDDDNPLRTVHVAAEGGAVEFRALLFVPQKRGFDWLAGPEKKSSLDLYVRRVLIQHESEELAPPYLRFVRGVVDCMDLPLNVSRETLQHDPRLARVRTTVVNRVLKALEDLKANDYDAYLKFYKEFGPYLKEGAAQDWSNREKLANLLLFESTKTGAGEYTTLARYVEGMAADQKEVYYLVGENRELLEHSPYLEAFRARGQEVLLLTEPIDEFLVGSMHEYKGMQMKAADRGEVGADKDAEEKLKAAAEQFKGVLEAVKSKLSEEIKDVRLSARLTESAAVLMADEGAMSAHMERLMQRLGRGAETKPAKRILELNADHPAVQALRQLYEREPSDARVDAWARLLYDQAVIAEGSRVKDPAAMAKRINDLIAGAGAGRGA